MSARMREAVSDRATYGGFIAVGVIEAVVLTWLPELLGALRRKFPKVRVEIHSYTSIYLHEELLRGNLDLALTAEAIANAAIENSSICAFQMGWIIAPTVRGDPSAWIRILPSSRILLRPERASRHKSRRCPR